MFRRACSSRTFQKDYKCLPMIEAPKSFSPEILNGGKILLPVSTLEVLAHCEVNYPLLFQISSRNGEKFTHCGVFEFVAEEGRAYVPKWIMDQIGVKRDSLITIKNVTLSLGKFIRIQPQSLDFLDITNPKAVLERTFRDFPCLSLNDRVTIRYNDKNYELIVKETKPQKAISIIEADVEVDFEAPPGYVEPSANKKEPETETAMEGEITKDPNVFVAFSGGGQSLRGKVVTSDSLSSSSTSSLSEIAKSPSETLEKQISPSNVPSIGNIGKSASPRKHVSFGSFSAPNAKPVEVGAGKLVFGKVSTPTTAAPQLPLTSPTNRNASIGRAQGQTFTTTNNSFQAFSGSGNSLRGK